jgi:acyl-CoA reductase-like NAD-dependent aldehyde dehydrogenase
MSVIRADDESDALCLPNDTPYGLSSAVFSSDVERVVCTSPGESKRE